MSKAAVELRNKLEVAAMAAYLNGATAKQIDMIVALAKGSGDYNVTSDGHLTRIDATRIIDFMLENGAEPDWEISDEEWDAEDEAKAEAEKMAAYRKASKAQKKAQKALRDADAEGRARAQAAFKERATKAAAATAARKAGKDAERDALEAPFKARFLAAKEADRFAILCEMRPHLANDKAARKEIVARWTNP